MTAPTPLNYSVEEAAEALGISYSFAKKLIADGTIPSHKWGRRRLILASELERANREHAEHWREDQRVDGDRKWAAGK